MQNLIQDEVQELWEHSEEIARKFKLQIVETVGTTRIVLKKKGSRTVIKVGYPPHNRAEYAAYKALECSVLGDLLAPCLGVSKEGYALEMQFIPRAFPQARGEYYWFNPEFARMRDRLESHFSFIKRYNKYAWGADFHEENMRVMRNGDVKIIDYSNLLADMFSRISKTTVREAIKGILKLNFPKIDVKLSMRNRIISYRDNDVSYDVPVDPQRSEAII
ncbi:hypothetical protein [Marinobacter sp.]|uniref:hypothetical protein n=1 Tax=Marinobacter sp. TaxID=50741 RepID=UPI000C8D8B6C|nr:hypothetical protein [Marinobacter sp.]MAK51004.1 hypothetical protein [Marinobacter sp.]